MKKNTHPEYQEVLFVDSSTGKKFVCGSTLKTTQKESFRGKEYPVCHVSVSSSSHPFFTGSNQFVDAEGRVDKFRKRYAAGKQNQGKRQENEE
jgi:large subunit ribosomal protein L31